MAEVKRRDRTEAQADAWLLEVLGNFHGDPYLEFYGPFPTREKMEDYADLLAEGDRDVHDELEEMFYHPLRVVPEEAM